VSVRGWPGHQATRASAHCSVCRHERPAILSVSFFPSFSFLFSFPSPSSLASHRARAEGRPWGNGGGGAAAGPLAGARFRPRARAPPSSGLAAVRKPACSRRRSRARARAQRQSEAAERRQTGELRPDPFIPRGVMDGRRWCAQVGSPPPLFLARVTVSFSRSDLDRISFFPFRNSFDPSSDPFPNRSTSLDRLTDTIVRSFWIARSRSCG